MSHVTVTETTPLAFNTEALLHICLSVLDCHLEKVRVSPNHGPVSISQPSETLQNWARPNQCSELPLVLDVLVDHPRDAHGHNSVVPGGDEHQSHTHAHA